MSTRADKIGKKVVYYCPRLNEIVIVMRTPDPPGKDPFYTVSMEYSDGQIQWPVHLWPEVQQIHRFDQPRSFDDAHQAFIKGYQGLYYIGKL